MRTLLACSLLAACATAAGGDSPSAAGPARADEGPIVLELFTSQGCSSCPPADALLDKLAHDGTLGGRPVAPLAFHVDYWDDLGWTDPFATRAWTERQQMYARVLEDRHVYTPELVVAGGAGMVGSVQPRVEAAIAAAPHQAAVAATATWEAGKLTVHATAPEDADVWVAIWQETSRTKIERGENRGETLVGERVVRRLEHVATAGHAGDLAIALPADWRAGGAVAFAQRPDRRIVAAKLLPR